MAGVGNLEESLQKQRHISRERLSQHVWRLVYGSMSCVGGHPLQTKRTGSRTIQLHATRICAEGGCEDHVPLPTRRK